MFNPSISILRTFAVPFAPLAMGLGLSIATGALAQASDYPSKPIRIIVPAGAGGAADLLARAVAERMGPAMKTSIVVDNKGGAGGIIGADAVAKAAPDGYTLMVTSNTLVIAPSLFKAPYNTQKDLAPIGMIATSPNILAVSAESKIKTLAELIALAKKSPGDVTYGSPAIGSAAHLTVEMLSRAAGIQMTHVPFKGPQQAVLETLSGRIPVTIAGVSNVLPHIASGKLVPLAVTGTRRSPLAPGIPTFEELGIKDVNVTLWFGMFAPAATPAPIVQKLSEQLNLALKNPATVAHLATLGFEPDDSTSADLADTVRREEPTFAAIIKAAGIKAD
jgi:tripartite-type tricarboxylate transporter receptor subunit TctC